MLKSVQKGSDEYALDKMSRRRVGRETWREKNQERGVKGKKRGRELLAVWNALKGRERFLARALLAARY